MTTESPSKEAVPPSVADWCAFVSFVVSLLGLSWFAMMAIHEFGHVVGAWWTGGAITQVVLHPFKISQTMVFPNPRPDIVVWLGPIIGCAAPLALWLATWPLKRLNRLAGFFAGFCLLANGAYIGFGALEGIGDAGVIMKTTHPSPAPYLFGVASMIFGGLIWHRLGSLSEFLVNPQRVPKSWTLVFTLGFVAMLAAACLY